MQYIKNYMNRVMEGVINIRKGKYKFAAYDIANNNW